VEPIIAPFMFDKKINQNAAGNSYGQPGIIDEGIYSIV
jgi:hypothetical protein